MADARLLLFGVLTNVFSVFSPFMFAPLSSPTNYNTTIAFMSTTLTAGISFTMAGILRRGSVNGDAAGMVTIGNLPVWMFGYLYMIAAVVDYSENLDKCQDYYAGFTAALYNCQQIPYALFGIGFFIATLCMAAVSTLTGLFFLRKASKTE